MRDFNLKPAYTILSGFMESHNYFNLIKENSCFKGRGSCIILTNRKNCFKNTASFETGRLSDHHHLIYFMLKTVYEKEESKQMSLANTEILNEELFKMSWNML